MQSRRAEASLVARRAEASLVARRAAAGPCALVVLGNVMAASRNRLCCGRPAESAATVAHPGVTCRRRYGRHLHPSRAVRRVVASGGAGLAFYRSRTVRWMIAGRRTTRSSCTSSNATTRSRGRLVVYTLGFQLIFCLLVV